MGQMDSIDRLVEQGVEVRFMPNPIPECPCRCVLIDNGQHESIGSSTKAIVAFNKATKEMRRLRRETKAAFAAKPKK